MIRIGLVLVEWVDCETYRTTVCKKTPAELAAEEEQKKRRGMLGGWGAAALGGLDDMRFMWKW